MQALRGLVVIAAVTVLILAMGCTAR